MKKEKISLIEYIWLFIIGAISGYIIEISWYFLKHGVWINKPGLLYGPFKPIYGLGFVLIVLIMKKFKEKKLWFKFTLGVFLNIYVVYFKNMFLIPLLGIIPNLILILGEDYICHIVLFGV